MNCRLLYLVGQLSSGGLERQLYFLLKGIDKKRYQPEVVVWNFREDEVYVPRIRALGVPLHSFPYVSSRGEKLQALRRMVMQRRPGIVHSYTFYTNIAAWWATRGTQTIAIGAVRSDFDWARKESGPFLGRLSARWPRIQIFNSSTAAENARRLRGLAVPGQCFVVRNGLDLQYFQMAPLSPAGQVCVVGVGSLLPVKRWDRLLAAALALKRRGFDFIVRIVGDGPLLGPLKQQAQTLGVTRLVELTGHCDNIPKLMADATFLVHASDSEGCPNAVMEAMACGRAVVATDAGDIPKLVEDGKTGFVVPRGDETLLVERMATLISDRELCRCMGEAGRAKAEREFGLDRLVSETFVVYRTVGWKG